MRNKKHDLYYHIMLLPGMIMLVVFSIIPMFGIVMAFQKYEPAKGFFGSKFVGLKNFKQIFLLPDFMQIFQNTLIIAISKIMLSLIVPVCFAIVLSECKTKWFKKSVQTIDYLPNFLSWVIVAVILSNLLSVTGFVNQIILFFGGEPTMFLKSNEWFQKIVVISDIWKGFGYGAIIYLAAITNIDLSLYEAAEIDGASRMQKIWRITLPLLLPTVILMATLSLGNVLNAGFDQIFNMYSPIVYETGDIIDTYVYRMGLIRLQYSSGTAVGLFKSLVSFILIIVSYKLADKYAGYRIF